MVYNKLASAEVVIALVRAKATGTLTVTGDDGTVIVTGPGADRGRARAVLTARGLTCTPHPDRDEWSRA